MARTRIILACGVLTILITAFAPPSAALAARECDVKNALDALASARRAPAEDQLERTKIELAARKDLLRRIVACALDEVADFEASVKTVTTDTSEVRRLRDQLMVRIEQVRMYYEVARGQIDTTGLQGSRDISRTLLEWRRSTYAPFKEEIVNFTLWVKNQELIGTAAKRLQQIRETERVIKLADTNPEIRILLEAAEKNLTRVREENAAAQRLLEEFGPPDELLSRIKASLDALAETYRTFLTLSDAMGISRAAQ